MVSRVRPAEFFKPKQTSIWPVEGRAPCKKNGPHPRAIQLSLSQIQSRPPWQEGTTKSQDEAARSPEVGSSVSPLMGRHPSSSQESGGIDPTPKPHTSVKDTPESAGTSVPWPSQLTL